MKYLNIILFQILNFVFPGRMESLKPVTRSSNESVTDLGFWTFGTVNIRKDLKEKKYKCKKCSRTYVTKYSLDSHLKYECGVSPKFQCEYCQMKFKLKGNMLRHIGRVH